MIAIVGAGIGGLAAAIALRAVGIEVRIFEQASAFRRVGTAINMTPNAVKVLDALGVGDDVREAAYTPEFRISRTWDTGEVTSRVELGAAALARYGVLPLLLHRADLLAALEDALPRAIFEFGRKLVRIEDHGDAVSLWFADGSNFVADHAVGADGIHSVVRRDLFEPEAPVFTGMAAYRAGVPVERISGLSAEDLAGFVKWWGPTPQIQIVTFLISRGRELYVFATLPETAEALESWSAEGDVEELRRSFAAFHPDARAVIDAVDHALRTALYERQPLERWVSGNVVLLGDACHAMTPFMAQGAAMGLEDAAILARCLAASDDWALAAARYQRTRIDRATRIQLGSHRNDWLREGGNPDWVYGYDAGTAELA